MKGSQLSNQLNRMYDGDKKAFEEYREETKKTDELGELAIKNKAKMKEVYKDYVLKENLVRKDRGLGAIAIGRSMLTEDMLENGNENLLDYKMPDW